MDVYKEGQRNSGVLRNWQDMRRIHKNMQGISERSGNFKSISVWNSFTENPMVFFFKLFLFWWLIRLRRRSQFLFNGDLFELCNVISPINCTVLWSMFTIYPPASKYVDMEVSEENVSNIRFLINYFRWKYI